MEQEINMANKWTCPQCHNDVMIAKKKIGETQTYNVKKGIVGDLLIGTPGALAGFETSGVYECSTCGCKFVREGERNKVVEFGNKWKENLARCDSGEKFKGGKGIIYHVCQVAETMRYVIRVYNDDKLEETQELDMASLLEYDTKETKSISLYATSEKLPTRKLAQYYFDDNNELLAMVEKIRSVRTYLGGDYCTIKIREITVSEKTNETSSKVKTTFIVSAICALLLSLFIIVCSGVMNFTVFCIAYVMSFIFIFIWFLMKL